MVSQYHGNYFSYYTHPSQINCIKACSNSEEAYDLVAIGGESHVEILQRITPPSSNSTANSDEQDDLRFTRITTFHIGCPVVAVAWSSRSVSPAVSDSWYIQLLAAGSDYALRLLTFSPEMDQPTITPLGNTLSGHHAPIHDACFCTSETHENYAVSVGDDGLIIWNLSPPDLDDDAMMDEDGGAESTTVRDGNPRSLATSGIRRSSSSISDVPEPSVYLMKFPNPLLSVSAHPQSASRFIVSDSKGTVYVVDWTRDPTSVSEEDDANGLTMLGRSSSLNIYPSFTSPANPATVTSGGFTRGRHRVVELYDPRTLADGVVNSNRFSVNRLGGIPPGCSLGGSASWKPSDSNRIGATFGSRWCEWDLGNVLGGKPLRSNEGFSEGGHRFRWCPTNQTFFAVSSRSPSVGATIKVWSTSFPNSARTIPILPSPNFVTDFDWVSGKSSEDAIRAWMVVAIGRRLFSVPAGDPLNPSSLAFTAAGQNHHLGVL